MNKIYSLLSVVVLLLTACSESDLSQKHIALLGDSMTWYGGDLCELDRGWTYHFRRAANPKSITTYARSGATWTNTDSTIVDTEFYAGILHDKNVIYNQVQRMLLATENGTAPTPDIILLYAGGNDVSYSDRRPGIFDLTARAVLEASPYTDDVMPSHVTSLAGSVRLSVELLRENFPDARIVLMTPLEKANKSVEEVHRVGDIIDSIGSGMGLEVWRADRHVNIRHEVEKQQFTYTCDGVHTNPEGAKLIADFVISKLGGKE